MLIYLMGFACSTAIIAAIQNEKRSSFGFVSCSILALLIPCLIAAFRAETIGTDTSGYALGLYELANRASSYADYNHRIFLLDGWNVMRPTEFEVGFSFVVYLVGHIFHSFSAVLFSIEFLIIAPIYISLLRMRDRLPLWLGMLVFYLLFFNITLNMMRQWIALAFLLLAFTYIRYSRPLACGLLIVIATLFHTSAIVGVLIVCLYYYSSRSSRGQLARVFILFIMAVSALLAFRFVVSLLSQIGFARYVSYFNGSISLMPNQIIMRLPLVLFFFGFWNNVKDDRVAGFYLAMMLLDLVTSQLTSLELGNTGGSANSRITLFFSIFYILSLPYLYNSEKRIIVKTLFLLTIILYMIIYWWYIFSFMGYNATVPYISVFG